MYIYFIRILIIAPIFIFILSCESGSKVSQNYLAEGILLEVAIPAGEFRNVRDHYPVIGNLAYLVDNNLDTTEVLLISQRLKKGTKVYIDVVAGMQYQLNGKENRVIVVRPSSKKLRYPDISDLQDLSIFHGSLKRMVEQWYEGNAALGSYNFLKWENKNQIENFISNNLVH